MSYSQWADFVYYKLGDIATFGSITYQALQPNINVVPTGLAPDWQVLPSGGAGVSSLETLTGAITLSCSSGTYTTAGNDIALSIAFPAPPAAPTTSYGSFYSTTTQVLTPSAETILVYDNRSVSSGDIQPAGGVYPTRGIVVADAGVYKFLFSIQIDRTGGSFGDFQAYVKVNGSAVPETNTQIIVNNNTQTINTCEFILNLGAGDVVEVGCWTNSAGQQALAVPISPTTPVAIPSIISNIYRLA